MTIISAGLVPDGLVAQNDVGDSSSFLTGRIQVASSNSLYRYNTNGFDCEGPRQEDPNPFRAEEITYDENKPLLKEVDLVSCLVKLTTNFQEGQAGLKDFVQACRFSDFTGLSEFMASKRMLIEKRHEPTLRLVHEQFRPIVQEIIDSRTLYRSVIGRANTNMKELSDFASVAKYASPNVRLRRGKYATFLHSDAIFSATSSTQAMINTWISLNQTPPSNYPLCFYTCPVEQTVRDESGKRYAKLDHMNQMGGPLVFDPEMCWGSFYCFIAGQSESDKSVLLHGAVEFDSVVQNRALGDEPRKSLELRYLV